MKWQPIEKPRKSPKYSKEFEPWFAWYPVTLTDGKDVGKKVWLETVLARYEIVFVRYNFTSFKRWHFKSK